MMTFDLFAGTDDHRSLDHVAQFANIAGPGMKLQRSERRRTEKTRRASVFFGQLGDQMLRQQRQVFLSFAE